MKACLLILPVSIILISSCVNNHVGKAEPPTPILPFKPVPIAAHKKHPGHSLYMTTCHQCHQQADPTSLSMKKWKNIVPEMAAHAGITQKEGQQVLDYILYVKSQGVR